MINWIHIKDLKPQKNEFVLVLSGSKDNIRRQHPEDMDPEINIGRWEDHFDDFMDDTDQYLCGLYWYPICNLNQPERSKREEPKYGTPKNPCEQCGCRCN